MAGKESKCDNCKIRLPKVTDLGCNSKAYDIEVVVGERKVNFCLSYDTIVASVDEDGNPHLYNVQSNTTRRHLNEWFSFHGWANGFYKQLKIEEGN